MSGAFLLGSLLAVSSPAACVTPPPVYVAVLIDVSAVATRTDFSLEQIQAMHQQAGGNDRHPALGFYGHRFGYTVDVKPTAAADGVCVGSVQVGVHMVLSQRVIEIARDLQQNPCLYAIAKAHYARHAQTDDMVLRDYVQTIKPTLQAQQLVPSMRSYAMQSFAPDTVDHLVHKAVDASLTAYNSARRSAQTAVDSRTEAIKMTTGCTAPAPGPGHI